jgi:hypothetical protein
MAQFDQKARIQEVAANIKLAKEQTAKQEIIDYENSITGTKWNLFKGIVVFCCLMAVLTTLDTFIDGGERTLDSKEWRVDRSIYSIGYQSIWVNDALFMPSFDQWIGFEPNSFEVTESFIFRDEKHLHFVQVPDKYVDAEQRPIQRHTARIRSIYNWFPALQVLLLIPLLTFFFKRKAPLFNFARIVSLYVLGPLTFGLLIYLLV